MQQIVHRLGVTNAGTVAVVTSLAGDAAGAAPRTPAGRGPRGLFDHFRVTNSPSLQRSREQMGEGGRRDADYLISAGFTNPRAVVEVLDV